MNTEPTVRQEPATSSQPEVLCTEAPASWNTSYVTQDSFVCRLALRGESGKDLLEKAGLAMAYLMEHGYQPERSQRKDTKQCPIHHCEMRSFEKDGHKWYSHKLDDGSWCNGKKQVQP